MSQDTPMIQAPEISFRAPRCYDWRSLSAGDESNKETKALAERAREELSQMLRASLRMEHVVVLAGSGCSLSVRGPSMGDLWNAIVGAPATAIADATAKTVGFDLTNTNIEAFLSHIEAWRSLHSDQDVETFLTSAKEIILERCSGFLKSAKLETHERFLHRLSRRGSRDRRLKLFTTNYDLCFEQATSAIGGVAIDGFSFMAPRRYDPRYFDYDIVRRPRSGETQSNYLEGVVLLHKLHGSVNWERHDGDIFETESPSPDKACLIYPATGKYQQSYSQPYLESISQYLAALREPNTCVLVVGFGFNDDHLSEPLLSAVRSNPHLRLIVVDPSLESKNGKNNLNTFQDRLLEFGAKGEDVWFLNATFDAFANQIPDLKSLTPAERLVNAVRGIQNTE
ncbi:MAG: SIR2 family protein [Opitutales bacterium]|nr:SIR2 family protein [Opitutales bacterium]